MDHVNRQRNTAPRLRIFGVALFVLVGVVLTSQLVETVITRVLRPDLKEWTWISEAIVIAALLVLTTLWSQLRLARTAIADLERERLTIQTELAVAAKVQRALLPPIPERVHDMVWHAVMEPAGQVGGDYYDFFTLSDKRMCVVLADVSGKGVPAAVFVSNTRAMLRAVARAPSTPGGVLATVSEMVRLDGQGDLYVTCFVAIVDTARHAMVYANAGHPPGIILREHRAIRALDTGGPPLGLVPEATYEEEHITLEPGDLVVLVSDGITDAIGATGLRIPAAIAAELEPRERVTPIAACEMLLQAARQSKGPYEGSEATWADDRTVVAFTFSPGGV